MFYLYSKEKESKNKKADSFEKEINRRSEDENNKKMDSKEAIKCENDTNFMFAI